MGLVKVLYFYYHVLNKCIKNYPGVKRVTLIPLWEMMLNYPKSGLRPRNQVNSITTAMELCYWENLLIFSHINVTLIFLALITAIFLYIFKASIVAVKYGSEILVKIFYYLFYLKMYILRVVLSLKNIFLMKIW